MQSESKQNIYLSGSLTTLFAKTASPIIIVMAITGLFTVVDAYFLGKYVGADALTAVTLMFPIYMLLVALSTLVSNGFSSIYARLLGSGKSTEANLVFAQAIQLSLLVCLCLIIFIVLVGKSLIFQISNESTLLANMGYTYISLLIFYSPLMFLLSVNIDALRCEGKLSAMAAITFLSALLNILFDYLLIAEFDQGVAGSAYGTILAQLCSMAAIITYRHKTKSALNFSSIIRFAGTHRWARLLSLGAPTSLSYLGIALSASLILYSLQIWAGDRYEVIAGAYGILTRLMTFTFLPLLGISIAFQTIAGNNYGAKEWMRSNKSIQIALIIALIYCIIIELIYLTTRNDLGFLFVDNPAIAAELARIIPYTVLLMIIFGPQMMISGYFQAIGDAPRAALLGLSKTYLFALPLTFTLPYIYGEVGIWYAGFIAEFCVALLTIAVLFQRSRKNKVAGLFEPTS